MTTEREFSDACRRELGERLGRPVESLEEKAARLEAEQGLDRSRRYLVPVARLPLSGQPDVVHLSVYGWLDGFEAWATGPALCGYSTAQGALPEGTVVTCESCLGFKASYEAAFERPAAKQAVPVDDPGDGAWHTVWLEGKWRWITSRMTTPQREHAADAAARYNRYLAEYDGDPDRSEPEGLRWWRDA